MRNATLFLSVTSDAGHQMTQRTLPHRHAMHVFRLFKDESAHIFRNRLRNFCGYSLHSSRPMPANRVTLKDIAQQTGSPPARSRAPSRIIRTSAGDEDPRARRRAGDELHPELPRALSPRQALAAHRAHRPGDEHVLRAVDDRRASTASSSRTTTRSSSSSPTTPSSRSAASPSTRRTSRPTASSLVLSSETSRPPAPRRPARAAASPSPCSTARSRRPSTRRSRSTTRRRAAKRRAI